MAELNVGSLSMKIEADGRAAIQELNRVTEAAEGMSGAVSGAGQAAGQAADGMADSLGDAGRAAGEAGRSAAQAGRDAGGLTGALREASAASESAEKRLKALREAGEKLSKIGGTMTKFVTLPVTGLLTAATASASDMAETMGKAEVVFGRMSDEVTAWSERSIEAMGLAQSAALDFAAAYGDMGAGMGLAEAQTTEMSMSLTQLAADMASFKNIGVEDAARKLTAVYTGETESLKSLGIVMTQTNLEAFALSQGITKQISAMSQAEQVTLRYQYVMNATKNAQGDFQRTGGSLANQTRKLQQTVKQLGDSFGKLLIPMVTPVVEKLQQAVQWLSELDEGSKSFLVSVGVAAAAIGPLMIAGGKIVTMIGTIRTALTGLKAVMAALSLNPVMLAIAGIAAAGAGIYALTQALSGARKETNDTKSAYENLRQELSNEAKGKVTVSAPGLASLRAAKEIIDGLDGETFGAVVNIDGTRTDIDQDIEDIKAAIGKIDGDIELTGNGDALLSEEKAGLIPRIQEKLASLETVIPLVADEEKRAALESQLTALKGQLDGLQAGVTLTFTGEGEESAKRLADEIDRLPKDGPTYTVTGEFKVTGMQAEAIQKYAEALAAAASATGEYADRVDDLNQVANEERQRQISEVYAQQAEVFQELNRQYNSGNLSREGFEAGLAEATADAQEKIREIDAAWDAVLRKHEALDDGSRENDIGTTADVLQLSDSQTQATREETNQYYQALEQGGESAVAAEVVRQDMIQQTEERYRSLNGAVAEYEATVAAAGEEEARRVGEAEATKAALDALGDTVILSDLRWEELINNTQSYADAMEKVRAWGRLAVEEEDGDAAEWERRAAAAEAAVAAMIDEGAQGEALSDQLRQAYAAATNGAEIAAGAEQEIAEAQAEAAAKRAEALTTLQAAAQALSSEADGVFDSEQIGTLLNDVRDAGVEVSAETESTMKATQEAIDTFASSLGGSEETARAAIAAMQASMESAEGGARSAGGNAGLGFAGGLRSKENEVRSAANRLAGIVSATFQKALDIHSPSRKMRDMVGAMIPRGIAQGIEQETPAAVKAVKKSAGRLISGAMAVSDRGGYTKPVWATASAASGIDYGLMGEAMSEAMERTPISFSVGGRELSRATAEDAARAQARRARDISIGKVRN